MELSAVTAKATTVEFARLMNQSALNAYPGMNSLKIGSVSMQIDSAALLLPIVTNAYARQILLKMIMEHVQVAHKTILLTH